MSTLNGTGRISSAMRADDALHSRASRLLATFGLLRKHSGNDYLFGDPGLEILLLLFAAERDRKRLSMKSLSIGTATPLSTALRWVERLAAAGYAERCEHPLDRRVAHLVLTPKGKAFIEGVLEHE